MNRPALVLALLGTAGLALVALAQPGTVGPPWAAPALVLAGLPLLGWGIARSGPRFHTAGVLLQLAGLALTGPFLEGFFVWVGTAGAVMAVGAWTLVQTVPESPGGGVLLTIAGTVVALLAATAGWALASGLAGLAGGGADARAAVAAWVVLLTASTWALVRWAGRGATA